MTEAIGEEDFKDADIQIIKKMTDRDKAIDTLESNFLKLST